MGKTPDLIITASEKAGFVPKHAPLREEDLLKIRQFFDVSRKTLVLTGAGISTESGIPDYRSEGVGLYARTDKKPITFQEFVRDFQCRKRYWARSFVAWPKFCTVKPGLTHEILLRLERDKPLAGIITQNVDNLHRGCRNLVELHGTLHKVCCVKCGKTRIQRGKFQEILARMNERVVGNDSRVRPDGDIELSDEQVAAFEIPPCSNCGEYFLKPDAIFFGENVPMERTRLTNDMVRACDSLLILGSSLAAYSSYRIVLKAFETKKRIAIVSIGTTRADHLTKLKVEAKCGEVLSKAFPEYNQKTSEGCEN